MIRQGTLTKSLKIALIGTRGVPANYGGFETCVEELGKRLVERGHEVTVYCRDSYYEQKQQSYLGMRLKYLPNLKKKSLDTLSHTFLSILDAVRQPYDVLMVFNAANSSTLFLPRMLGKKIAINTDGLEWKRGKWGAIARRYYKMSEWLSTKLAHRIVADSIGIQDYYREHYGVETTYIAYGAYISQSSKPELLNALGLTPGEYFLQITRFEPENNPLLTIEAYNQIRTDKKLVIVGGVPYESEYSRRIKASAGDNILLPGPIYDKVLLNELWCNCYAYVHGNEVGGTNPALLQTMASGCFTMAIDVPFSHDVLRDGGIYFDKDTKSLASKMQWSLEHPAELEVFKQRALSRIRSHYSWETVTESYEQLFNELVYSNK
jgi:glycosyltransferase involved in cell wall biosynthesis